MSWSDACLGFLRKYGKAAKLVASAVLNVVAPGSAALVGRVENACDAAHDAAGLTPRDLGDSLRLRQDAVADIHHRNSAVARPGVVALESRLPASATVHVLAAGAAVVDYDYPALQRELGKAVQLKPADTELVELHQRATVLVTSAKVSSSRHPTPATDGANPRLQVGDILDGRSLEARLGSGVTGADAYPTRQDVAGEAGHWRIDGAVGRDV